MKVTRAAAALLAFSLAANLAANLAAAPAPKAPPPDPFARCFLGVQEPEILDQQLGVMAGRVIPGSPAAIAGMQEGDRVMWINDDPTPSMQNMVELLRQYRPGAVVEVRILRGPEAEKVTLRVVLAIRPDNI
jgi:S1-C subfamily serine protease